MTKYLIAALAVITLLLAGVSTLWYRSNVALVLSQAQVQEMTKAQERAQEALKRSQALSARLAREKAATARESALLRQSLEAALDRSPEWRDEPVPKEVQDALAE
jgi:hypothetical protein